MPLLFELLEVPQTSVQFSPFELVYGHKPCGLMQVVREGDEENRVKVTKVGTYRQELLNRLHKV